MAEARSQRTGMYLERPLMLVPLFDSYTKPLTAGLTRIQLIVSNNFESSALFAKERDLLGASFSWARIG